MALVSSWTDRTVLRELLAAATWVPSQPARSLRDSGTAPKAEPPGPRARFGPTDSEPTRPTDVPPVAVQATDVPPADVPNAPSPPQAAAVPPPPAHGSASTLTAGPAPAVPAPYRPLQGRPLGARLDHLLAWASHATQRPSTWVADHDGLLLATRGTHESETTAAVLQGLLRGLDPVLGDTIEGHVVLRTAGRELHVAWHATDDGRYFLGLEDDVTPPHESQPTDSALGATFVVGSSFDLGRALGSALDEVNA